MNDIKSEVFEAAKNATDLSNYKSIDLSIYSEVDEKSDAGKQIMLLPMAVGSLICLSGFTGTGKSIFDFPFNHDGLKWVEEYLNNMVKPFVAKSDEFGRITRVKKSNGLKTSKPDEIMPINVRFNIAELVANQCLAQQHNAKYCSDGMELVMPDFTLKFMSAYKIRKFVKYGDEDSLQAFSMMIENSKKTNETFAQVEKQLIAQGVQLNDATKRQLWTGPTGSVERIVFHEAGDNKEDIDVRIFNDEVVVH